MKKSLALFCLLIFLFPHVSQSQDNSETKMQWFKDAKLGIFVHWGIYSVNGVAESWSFFNNYISHQDYMKQLDGFTAEKYDPAAWVKLIKESGARYAVITSKHHDGIALWNSKAGGINTLRHSAAKKDVLTPLVNELRKEKLKTGIYFSLPDWSHPDYDIKTRDTKRYSLSSDPGRWSNYLKYYHTQLRELADRYNPDLYWFDGDWEHTDAEWQAAKVRDMLRSHNPQVIINSRLKEHGDYATPEQGVPVVRPKDPFWELCLTMNDSWGYQKYDRNYKTSNQIIRTFIDCIANGGNLLLDIGPKADGTIAEEQVHILKQLGRWTNKHQEAIFNTIAGIPDGYFSGKTTLSPDRKKLYLFLENIPAGPVRIEGLLTSVKSIKVVGSNGDLKFNEIRTSARSPVLYIDLPAGNFDTDVTVLALSFDQPLQLAKPLNKELSIHELSAHFDKMKRPENEVIGYIVSELGKGRSVLKDSSLILSALNPVQKTAARRWLQKHFEVVKGVLPGLPPGHYNGVSAMSEDKQTLYFFINGKPNGPIAIKGIKNKIQRVRVAGNGTMLSWQILNKQYWSDVPGILYINVPDDLLDKEITVIAVLVDKPVEVYREDIKPIESN